jgi:hypothetical protein
MPRLQLFELHELAWFPACWRNLFTDFMTFYAARFRPFSRAPAILAAALDQAGTNHLLDLCSGGGTAAIALKAALDATRGAPIRVTLTDKYPNLPAFEAAARRCPGEVDFVTEPVDATDVPAGHEGFRILLGSFHHFPPATARAILADAARRRCGIAVFEYTERRLLWVLPLLLTPGLLWCTTPFMRPMTWQRLLWTYLLPVVPLVALWDGLVSVLRSYTAAEMLALASGNDTYQWQSGHLRSLGASRVVYLVGLPRTPTA